MCVRACVRSDCMRVWYGRRGKMAEKAHKDDESFATGSEAESEERYHCPYVSAGGTRCPKTFGNARGLKDHLMFVHVASIGAGMKGKYRVLPIDDETRAKWAAVATRRHRKLTPWPPRTYEAPISAVGEPLPIAGPSSAESLTVGPSLPSSSGAGKTDKRRRSSSPSAPRRKRRNPRRRAKRRGAEATLAAGTEVQTAAAAVVNSTAPTAPPTVSSVPSSAVRLSALSTPQLERHRVLDDHGSLRDRVRVVHGLPVATGLYVDIAEIDDFMQVTVPPRPATMPTTEDFLPSIRHVRDEVRGDDSTAAMTALLQNAMFARPEPPCRFCTLPRGPCRRCVSTALRPVQGDDIGDSSWEAHLRRVHKAVFPVYQELLMWFPAGPCRVCPIVTEICRECVGRYLNALTRIWFESHPPRQPSSTVDPAAGPSSAATIDLTSIADSPAAASGPVALVSDVEPPSPELQ